MSGSYNAQPEGSSSKNINNASEQLPAKSPTQGVSSIGFLAFPPSHHRYTDDQGEKKENSHNLSFVDSPKFLNSLSPSLVNSPHNEGTFIAGLGHNNIQAATSMNFSMNNFNLDASLQKSPPPMRPTSPPPLMLVNNGTVHTELPSLSNILNPVGTTNNNTITTLGNVTINRDLSEKSQITGTNLGSNDSLASNTPTNTILPKKGTKLVKGSYSRNGCQSCKQRRQKCSEDKPVCWNCKRLNRECVYIPNLKNKKRETKKKTELETVEGGPSGKRISQNPKAKKAKVSKKSKDEQALHNNHNQIDKNEIKIEDLVNYEEKNIFESFEDLDSSDVNLLLQNLNDIVSMKLHDSNITLDDYEIPGLEFFNQTTANGMSQAATSFKSEPVVETKDPEFSHHEFMQPVTTVTHDSLKKYIDRPSTSSTPSQTSRPGTSFPKSNVVSPLSVTNTRSSEISSYTPAHTPNVPVSVLVDSPITFNTPVDSFSLGGKHDEYMKVFYYDCMDSIAPFAQNQVNPLRDTLLSFAKHEPYLLSAILAVGASILFRKSQSLDDEKLYCQYLTHCLNLLSEQFKVESNLLNKIEPVILTVIMLAWDCVYTMNSQWRSHLKGVTKLFQKINSSSSKVLNLAKCWFKVIETFANISTVLGGALLEDVDLDVIFDPYNEPYIDSLKFLNVITQINDFNLLRGHKEDFDLVIKEVIKMLNSIRHSEKNYFNTSGIFNKDLDYLLWSPTKNGVELSYFKIQKILSEIDRQLECEFIDKSGIIPVQNPRHPTNSGILDNAIDLVKLQSTGEVIAISWYDISHQTQVLSFLLIVLLKLLGIPKESIMVQQVVERITGFFKFLDSENPPKNLRTCYCNFAILIAGLNAQDEKTRDIIRRYYEVNGDRFQRLTEHNLNRLEKVWYGMKTTDGKYNLKNQDVLTW